MIRGLKVCLFLTVVLVSLGFVGSVDAAPSIEFVDPTPTDGINTTNTTIEINVSITESDLGEMKFNWNGVNYTFYDDSLVLMMNFDNVSVLGENDIYAVDVSKYGNNGTAYPNSTNLMWTSSGKVGNALEFDGDGDYVDCDNDTSLGFDAGKNYTWSAWVFLKETGKNQILFWKKGASGGYYIRITSSNTLKIANHAWAGVAESSFTVSQGEWMHLVVVYTNNTQWFYKNGIEGTSYSGANTFLTDTTTDLYFGNGGVGASDQALNGTIDEVAIWNKSLSADEINTTYQRGLNELGVNITNNLVGYWTFNESSGSIAEDSSEEGNNGTLRGRTTAINRTSEGRFGGAFEFDGDDDYIDVENDGSLNITNGIFTVSYWMKSKNGSLETTIGAGTVISKGFGDFTSNVSSNQKGFIIASPYYVGSFHAIGFNVGNGSGDDSILHGSNSDVEDNEWHHIVGVADDTHLKIYLDGLKVGSTTRTYTGDISVSRNLNIGRWEQYARYFNGTIDEVRIWNRSLSADEVKQHYYGNLYKYDLDKWALYTNESDLNIDANTYFAAASDSAGNENLTETRTIRILTKTTQYYDNRKMSVVWTDDDWSTDWINKHVHAANYAQSKKVIISPAIYIATMDSSEWEALQTEVDEGFISPVPHSVTHPHVPYSNTTYEVCDSRSLMIGNLTLPWQNWFNGSEYSVGWVEPFGESDAAVRGNLSECNYLSDRTNALTTSSWWASWADDGLYARSSLLVWGDSSNLTTLNNTFDTVYSDGGIYHLFIHSRNHNWSETDKIPQHLTHIGNRTDVWYVGWGQLYMYHYLEDRVTPTINLTTRNNHMITAKINASGAERNKYGLSYPVTYAFAIPSVWSNVFVFYKNTFNEDYTLMTEKTSSDFFNGIDAYRTNLSENGVYVSKGFPQTSNEFYLKIIPVPLSDFNGTDLYSVDISNITNLVLENSNYGKINFSGSVNLSGGANLNTHVNISHNRISINSTALSELNKSATLTLYNLTFTNPRVLRDGEVCPSSICTEVSYVGGNFTFTVTSFSAYSAEETPTEEEPIPSVSGGGYPTFKPTQEQLKEGYEKPLRKNWKIQFEFNNETHTIKLGDIVNKTAIITVSSEPVTFNLTINETKKLNLDDDEYYDLQVFLKDITDYEADLVVKLIHEEIPCEPNWECEEWGECVNYTQARICTDWNNCNTTEGKPDEVKSCCEADWECSEWSECVNNIRTRTCIDLNSCNVTEGRPDEVRECEPETDYLNIVIVSVLIVAIVIVGFLVQKQI